MKHLFFLFCLALLASGNNSQPAAQATAAVAQHHASVEYRAFQPSKIKKQKRKLRQRVVAWGWGVAVGAVLLIGGLAWLMVWLWPMMAIGWRILMATVGISVAAVIAFMAMFLFVYAYPTQRDMRADAEIRLKKMAQRLPFEVAQNWCFPDDYFRMSLAANADGLLVVDYQQDQAWQIPKANVTAIQSAFVAADSAAQTYPASPERVVLLTQMPFQNRAPQPPYPSSLFGKPMQVLQLDLQNLPIRQLIVIYRGAIYSDSTQHIAGAWRELWVQ